MLVKVPVHVRVLAWQRPGIFSTDYPKLILMETVEHDLQLAADWYHFFNYWLRQLSIKIAICTSESVVVEASCGRLGFRHPSHCTRSAVRNYGHLALPASADLRPRSTFPMNVSSQQDRVSNGPRRIGCLLDCCRLPSSWLTQN